MYIRSVVDIFSAVTYKILLHFTSCTFFTNYFFNVLCCISNQIIELHIYTLMCILHWCKKHIISNFSNCNTTKFDKCQKMWIHKNSKIICQNLTCMRKTKSYTFYMSKCKEKVRKQVSWKKMYSFNNISINFIEKNHLWFRIIFCEL